MIPHIATTIEPGAILYCDTSYREKLGQVRVIRLYYLVTETAKRTAKLVPIILLEYNGRIWEAYSNGLKNEEIERPIKRYTYRGVSTEVVRMSKQYSAFLWDGSDV